MEQRQKNKEFEIKVNGDSAIILRCFSYGESAVIPREIGWIQGDGDCTVCIFGTYGPSAGGGNRARCVVWRTVGGNCFAGYDRENRSVCVL